MFGPKLPLKLVADWLRALHTSLNAGLSAKQAFKHAAQRGEARTRAMSQTVLDRLNEGDDLPAALRAVEHRLPPLVLSMAQVSSEAGRLPETLRDLEAYFRFRVQLRRQFLSQITLPVVQFTAAILIVALLIWIMGVLPTKMDVLGLGLIGGTGAMLWLTFWFGGIAFLAVLYRLLRLQLNQADLIDPLLLRIPALGPCLHTLALSRLSLALSVTLDTNLPIHHAVRQSLDASENGAFRRHAAAIVEDLKDGQTLSESFGRFAVFAPEFIDVVANAEHAGTVPESLERLSQQYLEQAQHQMKLLNTAAGWVVWCLVAAIIIFFIFRIVTIAYLGPINQALKGL